MRGQYRREGGTNLRDIFSSPMHLQFDFLDLSSSLLLNDDKTSAGNDISLFFKGVQDEKERASERPL